MNRNAVEAKEKLRRVESSVVDLGKSLQESRARAADAEGLSEKLRSDLEAAAAAAAGEAQRAKDAEAGVQRATAERDAAAQRADEAKAAATKARGDWEAERLRGAALEGEVGTLGRQSKELQDKLRRTEQRAKELERKADTLEGRLDEERAASAESLDEAVTIVEEWQGRAYDAMRRVDDQKVLARRARDLARMLRTVDKDSMDRPLDDGETIGGLLQDAEDKLLAALVAEGRAALEAEEAKKKPPAQPSWLPKAPWD